MPSIPKIIEEQITLNPLGECESKPVCELKADSKKEMPEESGKAKINNFLEKLRKFIECRYVPLKNTYINQNAELKSLKQKMSDLEKEQNEK